jgi:hypothetical protein
VSVSANGSLASKPLRDLAHAISPSRRFKSGTDLRFQLWRYPWATELLALCLSPPKAGAHPLLNDRALPASVRGQPADPAAEDAGATPTL